MPPNPASPAPPDPDSPAAAPNLAVPVMVPDDDDGSFGVDIG